MRVNQKRIGEGKGWRKKKGWGRRKRREKTEEGKIYIKKDEREMEYENLETERRERNKRQREK